MDVLVNGKTRELSAGTTVGRLVRTLDLVPQRVAVELNKRIVGRADYDTTELRDGDQIEIVTFEGGG